jgi:hypothetical protein
MTSFAYLHCKPDGIPFYVGKGALRRAKYLGERNAHHKAIVNKYGRENILKGIIECTTDKIALDLEVGIIKCLKRMNVKLSNFTDGGEGTVNPTPEARQRMSEAAKKRGVSEACKLAKVKALKGKPLTEEQKLKQSISMTGKIFTAEHRRNISISAKERGMLQSTLDKAHQATRGRVQPLEERLKRGEAIRKAKQLKKLKELT